MNYRIVIVNYGKTAAILRLLSDLAAQTLMPSSVCIIDNSPANAALPIDAARPIYPFRVDVRYTPQNLGYARACNLGAEGSDWSWIALVNPDIEIDSPDFFERLVAQSRQVPDLGCAGVAQRNPDGTYELVARRFPSIRAIIGKRIPLLGRRLLKRDVDTYLDAYPNRFDVNGAPFSVDWLQSSFLLIPRESWQACNGLSECYFVFMADTDFGWRCREKNLQSWFFPNLEIRADGVRSSHGGLLDVFRKRTIRIHLRDAFKYFLIGLGRSTSSRTDATASVTASHCAKPPLR